jgi:hypothetical protein
MIMAGVPYSESISCGFLLFLSRMLVFLIMGCMHSDIAICVDSTPGCDLTFHTPLTYPYLRNLPSFSFAIHWSKISGTIGVSSESPFHTNHIHPCAHLILCRPHVHFHCDVDFDPFTYLRENNKTYGSFLTHTAPIQ